MCRVGSCFERGYVAEGTWRCVCGRGLWYGLIFEVLTLKGNSLMESVSYIYILTWSLFAGRDEFLSTVEYTGEVMHISSK